jgi:hypothetical protein
MYRRLAGTGRTDAATELDGAPGVAVRPTDRTLGHGVRQSVAAAGVDGDAFHGRPGPEAGSVVGELPKGLIELRHRPLR